MKKTRYLSCPMDCFDLCRFIVTCDGGRITGLKGDPDHPVTGGVVCQKARALVRRHNHPDRLTHPLIRKKSGFVKTTYAHVIDLICEQLTTIYEGFGPTAVLNYTYSGYGGLKAQIQTLFFNHMGGASEPVGSLCWGAGLAAQRYDFGAPKGHFPDDVKNSDLVLVWGRNPKVTNLHLYMRLKAAQKKGTRVIVIDPVKSESAKSFETHIAIRPGTDAALALAMARIIIENGWTDERFVQNHVKGFKRFKEYAATFPLQRAVDITGISLQGIEKLAAEYAGAQNAMIYIGYGVQRYHNGGNTVRAIDALGAVTGKIGRPGCGINYAAEGLSAFLSDVATKSRQHIKASRRFIVGRLGKFLASAENPGIKAVFVSGANPLTQNPDLKSVVSGFSHIPFKVVFDHFMTDTARCADIVLPAATIFEQDDVFVTSMYSPVLNYSRKLVEPRGGIIPEFDFYRALAERFNIPPFEFDGSQDFLEKSTTALRNQLNVSFDDIKDADQYLRLPGSDVAWEDRQFSTPSKKYELYSDTALNDGLTPMPVFDGVREAPEQFPLRLLTRHCIESLHSQGFAFIDHRPVVYINGSTAQKGKVHDGELVHVTGKNSRITAKSCVTADVPEGVAMIYQGFWHKSGSVNFLTEPVISDMGNLAAFHDSFVRIEKLKV